MNADLITAKNVTASSQVCALSAVVTANLERHSKIKPVPITITDAGIKKYNKKHAW